MNLVFIKTALLSFVLGTAVFALDLVPGIDPGLGVPYCKIDANDPLTAKDPSGNKGWYLLFNGTQASLDKYFFKPANTNHGGAATWDIQGDTVLISKQVGGVGGLLHTKHKYSNAEIKIFAKPSYGNDGGLFMHSDQMGNSWQMVIDYLGGKTVGGFWAEGLPNRSGLSQSYKPFDFTNDSTITSNSAPWIATKATPWVAAPGAQMSEWYPRIWNTKGFNWLHAQIFNNEPVKIRTYINGYAMIDYADVPIENKPDGYFSLQVHTGAGLWKGAPNQYKRVLVRNLGADGNPLASYPEWDAEVAKMVANGACPSVGIDPKMKSVFSNIQVLGLSGGQTRIFGYTEANYQLKITDLTGRTAYVTNGVKGNYQHVINLSGNRIYIAQLINPYYTVTSKIVPLQLLVK